MNVLITGITGFVGPHLARLLLEDKKVTVFGTATNRANLFNVPKGVKIVECELTDPKNVDSVIQKIKPDFIYHLAAQSFVPTSWASPGDTLTNNIISELNILEAVRKYAPDCVVQIACSSEEYGKPLSIPITESHPLNPLSPYGVSKVAQEKLGCQYHASYGLKVVITRAFNHTGPGRDPRFAEASFAKQIANGNTVRVGNLNAERDYTDVRDTVRGYFLAATSRVYGLPMNISSGNAYSMLDILNRLIDISGKAITVKVDKKLLRPSDIPILVGDSTFFRELTGWKPTISIDQTLTDLYNSFL